MKRISSVYFFPFLNTYKFQYLGRLGGKQFKRYLAFNWFISQILIFYGRAVFCRIWREGTGYLLSKILSALPRSFGNSSTHLVTSTAVPALNSFHRRGTRQFFGIRSVRPLTATSVLKSKFFILISSDEKGTTFGAKASANHLAPSSSSSSTGRATQ